MKPMWQRGRKGSPGGLGKGSGFILNEMEATGPHRMSMCGGCKHYSMERWVHVPALEMGVGGGW